MSETSPDDSSGSERESDEEEDGVVQDRGDYQPYQYEPMPEDGVGEAENEQDEDGLTADILDQREEAGQALVEQWCSCGECATQQLHGAREYRCCREVLPAIGKLLFDGTADRVRCVCHHPDFEHIIYREVLLLSGPLLKGKNGKQYRQQGRSRQSENEFCRAVAYRWLVRWLCGHLGWDNTRPLSACMYKKIRTMYNTENNLRGFTRAAERQ